ncbi:Uncharacterized protein APZ42_028855 [Daphnia magna]|uniref:Uncharacterized protein n=1 Tax=Daphnia magna TaxID=35525 RepID=A0A162D603_9CRUS|nr:Uncharacterized protein APZ42_028855 [Daphnia magna]
MPLKKKKLPKNLNLIGCIKSDNSWTPDCWQIYLFQCANKKCRTCREFPTLHH